MIDKPLGTPTALAERPITCGGWMRVEQRAWGVSIEYGPAEGSVVAGLALGPEDAIWLANLLADYWWADRA